MRYSYMYVSDDLYNESYTTAMFRDFKDALIFYDNFKSCGKPCIIFKRFCSDNFNI